MNHKLNLCAALLLMASCASQHDDALNYTNETQTTVSSNRSIAEAIEIAQHAVNLLPVTSRSAISVDAHDVVVIRSSKSSRSGQSDTLLYAVNNEDNKGFTLVAAPKNVEPIIAITNEGTYGSDETFGNENFQFALAAAQQYIEEKSENSTASLVVLDTIKTSDLYAENFQTPRIRLKWGQLWPQNIYCPNKVAGCVPVAISQICSYFSEPSQIDLTFDERDKDIQELNWTDIKCHILTDTTQCMHQFSRLKAPSRSISTTYPSITLPNCMASDSAHYAIGRLVRQIGVIAKCHYNDGATGAFGEDAISAIESVLSDKTFTEFNETSGGDNCYQYMKDDGVAMVLGTNGIGSGHAWVADATGYIDYFVNEPQYDEETGEHYTVKTLEDTEHYIHYNWGWNGNCNGYFLVGIFAPGEAFRYDNNTSNTSSFNFKYNVTFIHTK